jgi:hypothetical protein
MQFRTTPRNRCVDWQNAGRTRSSSRARSKSPCLWSRLATRRMLSSSSMIVMTDKNRLEGRTLSAHYARVGPRGLTQLRNAVSIE